MEIFDLPSDFELKHIFRLFNSGQAQETRMVKPEGDERYRVTWQVTGIVDTAAYVTPANQLIIEADLPPGLRQRVQERIDWYGSDDPLTVAVEAARTRLAALEGQSWADFRPQDKDDLLFLYAVEKMLIGHNGEVRNPERWREFRAQRKKF